MLHTKALEITKKIIHFWKTLQPSLGYRYHRAEIADYQSSFCEFQRKYNGNWHHAVLLSGYFAGLVVLSAKSRPACLLTAVFTCLSFGRPVAVLSGARYSECVFAKNTCWFKFWLSLAFTFHFWRNVQTLRKLWHADTIWSTVETASIRATRRLAVSASPSPVHLSRQGASRTAIPLLTRLVMLSVSLI